MKIELIGSFGVFALCLALGSSRLRLPVYVVLAILLSTFSGQIYRSLGVDSYNLISFVIGMAYADAVNSSFPSGNHRERQSRLPAHSFAIAVVALALLVAAQIGSVANLVGLIPVPLSSSYARMVALFARYDGQLTMATAVVIVMLVDESPSIMSWLSRPFAVFLGKISFALYLVHFTIMASLSCFIFLSIYRSTGAYVLSSTIATVAGITVSLYAAVWFQRYVDAPAILFSHAFASFVMRCLPRLAIQGIADDMLAERRKSSRSGTHLPPKSYLGPSISHNNHGRPGIRANENVRSRAQVE